VAGIPFWGYAIFVSAQSPPRPLLSSEEEAAERAARVRAMLARWETARDGDEPDWDVDQLEPMSLPARNDDSVSPSD
jgi:hypothetical protein